MVSPRPFLFVVGYDVADAGVQAHAVVLKAALLEFGLEVAGS
jgi:hypothetical protein